VLIAVLLGSAAWSAPRLLGERLHRWLEDMTGERELRQQLEGLFLRLRQRPIETADFVPVRHAGVYPYGAHVFFEQEVEESKLRRSMEMLRDAGIRWIRQQFPWEDIEKPSKGAFIDQFGNVTWAKYDRIVVLAEEYGLEIVARPDLPPPWARADRSVPRGPPDRFEDYGDFVAMLAARYKGRVRYYQVWNEPNLAIEWGCPPDPQAYVRLLQTAYERIKAVDPSAVVLSAPLAQTLGTPDGCNMSDLAYLEAMYVAGAAPYFDILSANAHGLFTGPGDRRAEPSQTNVSRVLLIRATMVRHGDAGKAIWIAEAGWNAPPPGFPGEAIFGRVTDEEQARYTAALYRRAAQEWPWAGVLFYWFFRRPSDADRQQVDYYYRMVEVDFTPLPVYEAVRSLTREKPVLGIGYHQEGHWALEWSGSWSPIADPRMSLGHASRSSAPGAALRFRFRGTDLTLVTCLGPDRGQLRITLSADRMTEERAVVLHAPTERCQQHVPLLQGAPPGVYTVTLQAQGPDLVVDGLIVQQEAGRFWLRRALGIGLLLGLLVFALVLLVTQYKRPPSPPL
jgi:hypothetical protein